MKEPYLLNISIFTTSNLVSSIQEIVTKDLFPNVFYDVSSKIFSEIQSSSCDDSVTLAIMLIIDGTKDIEDYISIIEQSLSMISSSAEDILIFPTTMRLIQSSGITL